MSSVWDDLMAEAELTFEVDDLDSWPAGSPARVHHAVTMRAPPRPARPRSLDSSILRDVDRSTLHPLSPPAYDTSFASDAFDLSYPSLSGFPTPPPADSLDPIEFPFHSPSSLRRPSLAQRRSRPVLPLILTRPPSLGAAEQGYDLEDISTSAIEQALASLEANPIDSDHPTSYFSPVTPDSGGIYRDVSPSLLDEEEDDDEEAVLHGLALDVEPMTPGEMRRRGETPQDSLHALNMVAQKEERMLSPRYDSPPLIETPDTPSSAPSSSYGDSDISTSSDFSPYPMSAGSLETAPSSVGFVETGESSLKSGWEEWERLRRNTMAGGELYTPPGSADSSRRATAMGSEALGSPAKYKRRAVVLEGQILADLEQGIVEFGVAL